MVWDLVLADILKELIWLGIGIIVAIIYLICFGLGSK